MRLRIGGHALVGRARLRLRPQRFENGRRSSDRRRSRRRAPARAWRCRREWDGATTARQREDGAGGRAADAGECTSASMSAGNSPPCRVDQRLRAARADSAPARSSPKPVQRCRTSSSGAEARASTRGKARHEALEVRESRSRPAFAAASPRTPRPGRASGLSCQGRLLRPCRSNQSSSRSANAGVPRDSCPPASLIPLNYKARS